MTSLSQAANGAGALLENLFAAVDSKDSDQFVRFLADDARFRFGSAPAVHGRAAIRDAVEQFFTSIQALEHQVTMVVESGNTLVCEGEVTYTRHDGSTISLPFADVFDMAGELVADYRIYMDISPLYAS